MDDGSTDDSYNICKRYKNNDSRIEVHRIPHSGIATVRNQLIKLANGKYSIFIDSDDYYTENHCIEKLVEYAEKTISKCAYLPTGRTETMI